MLLESFSSLFFFPLVLEGERLTRLRFFHASRKVFGGARFL